MKKIIIFTHNSCRDYCSDSLLAYELKQRGYMVWIKHFLRSDTAAITLIKPDIIFLPEARVEYTATIAQCCRNMGVKVILKPCEFGITEESLPSISDEYKRAIFGNIPLNDSIDLYLAWGPKMGEMTTKYAGISPEKVVAVGGYQFDQYFTPPPQLAKHGHGKTVLFAAGFAYADRRPEFSIPEAKLGEELHGIMQATDAKKRGVWLNTLRSIAPKLKDRFHVQVKPHPGETTLVYHAVLKDAGIEIIDSKMGFISIQQPDIIVHAGSTMAYEAHLLGKPAICYENNNRDVIFSKISPGAASEDELLRMILETPLGESNANMDIVKKMEDDYFGAVDGKSYVRIAGEIDKLVERHRGAPGTTIPDVWKFGKKVNHPQKGMFTFIDRWDCAACGNYWYVAEARLVMVKCLFCGIACIRVPDTRQGDKDETMQQVSDGGNETGDSV